MGRFSLSRPYKYHTLEISDNKSESSDTEINNELSIHALKCEFDDESLKLRDEFEKKGVCKIEIDKRVKSLYSRLLRGELAKSSEIKAKCKSKKNKDFTTALGLNSKKHYV